MSNRLTQKMFNSVSAIVQRRKPDLLELPFFSTGFGLTQEEREEIREVLADELIECGLQENSEPTAYGLEVETLIDRLGSE